MRRQWTILAAVAALMASHASAHAGLSTQQELAPAAEQVVASYGELERFSHANRALLQTQVRGGDDGGEEAESDSPAAGFGTTLSVNASKAFDEARGNPIFMNFTAVRAELAAMESAFGELEREAIDALTVAESKAVAAEEAAMVAKSHKVEGVEAANAAAALANAFKAEVGQLHEQESVLRYLRGLSAEAARINATATAATKEALAKQTTRNALRSDAEAAAGGYLGYNMAASSLSYEAVASFLSQAAGAQRAAEKWRAEAELRALHAVAQHLARLKAAAEGVGSTKGALKGLYGVAGAAKRLLDLLDTGDGAETDAIVAFATATDAGGKAEPFNASALAEPPRMTVGAVRILHSMGLAQPRIQRPDALVRGSPDDLVTVSAQDAELARLLNLLEQAAGDVESLATKLSSEQAGLRAALAAAAAAGSSGSVPGANGLMRQLGDSGVRELLEALKAALAEAGSQRLTGLLTGLLDGAATNRAWWMSPGAVKAEVSRLDAQSQRLAAGRKVLEAELERRASRDPAASAPGTAGDAPGSAVSSLETSVGVTVLKALLRADGSDAALAAASDEASLRALLAAGGGTLWHQAAELEEEARRVGTELAACKAEPSQFRPGCEPRLGFEEARLQEEAAKRRAAASAERAVLEKLAAELTAALRRCREETAAPAQPAGSAGPVEDDSAEAARKAAAVADHFRETAGAPAPGEGAECAAVEQAGVSAQLRTVSAALEARRQVEEDWAQRVELQCLWRHRRLSLTELVAQSLAKAPAAAAGHDGAAPEGDGSGEGPRLTRLLQVCAALRRPPLSGAEGAGVVEDCLCPEASSAHSLLVRARQEAASADAAKKAEEAARADAAADAAHSRASADDKEEEEVKTALFDYLRSRPEWSQMVSKAMAEEESKSGGAKAA